MLTSQFHFWDLSLWRLKNQCERIHLLESQNVYCCFFYGSKIYGITVNFHQQENDYITCRIQLYAHIYIHIPIHIYTHIHYLYLHVKITQVCNNCNFLFLHLGEHSYGIICKAICLYQLKWQSQITFIKFITVFMKGKDLTINSLKIAKFLENC